jgi:hypothetical protein
VTITTSESPATASEVILGIDTHLEVHVAVALDGLGRRLGARRAECAEDCERIPQTPALGGGLRSRVLCRC